MTTGRGLLEHGPFARIGPPVERYAFDTDCVGHVYCPHEDGTLSTLLASGAKRRVCCRCGSVRAVLPGRAER